jgi:hypothetical protein
MSDFGSNVNNRGFFCFSAKLLLVSFVWMILMLDFSSVTVYRFFPPSWEQTTHRA